MQIDFGKKSFVKFGSCIESRFPDFDKDGYLKMSAALTYFESSRLKIVNNIDFGALGTELFQTDRILFPVIELETDMVREATQMKQFWINTYIKRLDYPMLEFKHDLYDNTQTIHYIRSSAKLAFVDSGYGMIRVMESKILDRINTLIEEGGMKI